MQMDVLIYDVYKMLVAKRLAVGCNKEAWIQASGDFVARLSGPTQSNARVCQAVPWFFNLNCALGFGGYHALCTDQYAMPLLHRKWFWTMSAGWLQHDIFPPSSLAQVRS